MSENEFCCIINDLLENPFLNRNKSDKDTIINYDRPMPIIPSLTQFKSKDYRRFSPNYYERFDWLCGCQKLKKLFCWYCLLFDTRSSKHLWTSTGFSNMNQLVRAAINHAHNLSHQKHLKEYHKHKGVEVKKLERWTKLRIRTTSKRCVINQILGIPFLQQGFREQMRIFKNGRPTPLIEGSFDPENYLKYKWMAGSKKLNRLYCWQCLLFADESINAEWISIGFNKLNVIDESAQTHESSEIHKELSCKYHQFYQVNKDLENWDESILLTCKEEVSDSDEEKYLGDISIKEENIDVSIKDENVENSEIDAEMSEYETEDEKSDSSNSSSEEDTVKSGSTEIKNCIVDKILQDNTVKIFFINYPDGEQRKILENGRPKPLLKGRNGMDIYRKYEWLTASTVTNKYYCWYCLLMKDPIDDTKFWGEEGILDARNITKRASYHEPSNIHIQCSTKYNDYLIKHAVYIKPTRDSSSPQLESETIDSIWEPDIITQLKSRNFDELSPHEQKEILTIGRPTPNLPELCGVYAGRKRYFRPIYYHKYTWLCGSSKLNKLFCWYCLLSRQSLWGRGGVNNIGKLSESLQKHDICVTHLQNMEKYHQPVDQVQEQQYLSNNVLSTNSRCLINELIGYPFQSRLRENKVEIVRNGRPTPTSYRGDVFIEHFAAINYFKFDWLAGSKKLKKLFCWPCLLFGEDIRRSQVVWTQHGFDKIRKLSTAASKHENSQVHKRLVKKLEKFKQENELQNGGKEENSPPCSSSS